MTQLILDTTGYGIALPESKNGGYRAKPSPLSVDVEMATGRLVRELLGNVWVLDYQYGYFQTEMKNLVIAACEKGRRTPIRCAFLTPDSDGALVQSLFWVTKFNYPKFFWSTQLTGDLETPCPLWGDFSLTLREVEPSD